METSDLSSEPSAVPIKTPRCVPADNVHISGPSFPTENFRSCRDDLEIGEVLYAFGMSGLFFSVLFFILYIYSLCKGGLTDGFFEYDSRELDYYKRMYYD